MKKVAYYSAVIIVMVFFVINYEVRADNPPCPSSPTMKDIDGNVYKTVQIGNQCWMRENMRATRDKYGIKIHQGLLRNGSDVMCYAYPDDNPLLAERYGLLYNAPAARSVCPEGWHLPTQRECEALFVYCQRYSVTDNPTYITKALASKEGWQIYADKWVGKDPHKNNDSGFSALYVPSFGCKFATGTKAAPPGTSMIGKTCLVVWHFSPWNPTIRTGTITPNYAASVRCLKD